MKRRDFLKVVGVSWAAPSLPLTAALPPVPEPKRFYRVRYAVEEGMGQLQSAGQQTGPWADVPNGMRRLNTLIEPDGQRVHYCLYFLGNRPSSPSFALLQPLVLAGPRGEPLPTRA